MQQQGDAQDGNWVCVNHCAMAVSQAREEMLAVLVAVVMMLVMLTMIAANSYWAMHCISVHMEYLLDLPNNPKV